MKSIVIVASIVLVLGLVVLGGEKTWSYAKGGQRMINEKVDQTSPMPLEAARIRALMDRENERVLQYEDKVLDLQGRAEATQKSVAEFTKKLDGEKQLIEQIGTLLAKRQERYLIGGHEYSLAEVNSDALGRVEACKKTQEDIEFQKSLLHDLNLAVEQGRQSLGEAKKKYTELGGQLARLETRNANADIRMEVATLTNSLTSAPVSGNSALEDAFKNYERRVAQKERRAVSRLAATNAPHLINYDSNMVTQDAVPEIDRFLKSSSAQPPSSQTPETKPPASDAVQGQAKP